MQIVLLATRVITADDGGHTTNAAGHDGVVQRPEGGPVAAAQHVIDIFVRETGDQLLARVGDLGIAAIGIIVDGFL